MKNYTGSIPRLYCNICVTFILTLVIACIDLSGIFNFVNFVFLC